MYSLRPSRTAAVHSVAGHQEVHIADIRLIDPHASADVDAEFLGPGVQDRQQRLPPHAVAATRNARWLAALDLDDLLGPPVGVVANLRRGRRVPLVQAFEEVLPEDDAPPVGLASRIAVVYRHRAFRMGQSRENAEVQACRTPADTGDPA
jgi:hypothetical protein